MKSSARIWVALLSAVAVVFLVWMDLRYTGPGAITSVHGQVTELRQGQACALCHGAERGSLAQACLACHAEIETQLAASTGLHGQIDANLQRNCGECHQEHLGDLVALTGSRSFRLADLPGPEDFDHSTGPFALHGRHSALACVECHPNADLEVLPEGKLRYLGQTQACRTCHDDPHDGAMQRSCEACHGQEHKFEDLSEFLHIEGFPLHGSHSDLGCAACHEAEGPFSVAASSGGVPENAWRGCAQCHASPHRSSFLQALPVTEQNQCATCHSEQHAAFSGPQVSMSPEQHLATDYSLAAPHQDLRCEQCHDSAASGKSFSQRYPGRMAEQCMECHQDPHEGQFDHPPFLDQACLSCHQGDRFNPHDFGVEAHQQLSFKLTGSHQTAKCDDCHKLPTDSQVRVFAQTPRQCQQCHADAHAGTFAPVEEGLPTPKAGTCARCHNTQAFHAVKPGFDHALWTGFALTVGHAQADCAACHQAASSPDEAGRRFGRVADLHPGKPESCSGCHADVHGGNFDLPGLPAQWQGREGCARCHQTGAFHELRGGGFNHQKWTSFDLVGAHQFASCERCHGSGQNLPQARRLGLVAEHHPGDVQRCQTCHSDPHDGQFDRPGLAAKLDGKTGCLRCHDQVSFRISARQEFDHARWTGFALDGAHASLSCAQCHSVLPKPDSVGRSFDRAPGRSCAQCHADPHVGQFAKQGRTNCLQCHSEQTGSFALPTFDHSEQTRFVLDATHAQLDCAQCHLEWPLEGGGTAVRYRPLGRNCQDCHSVKNDDPGGGGDG
jgi:decaheme cytochrome c component MtrC/MtrF-like protein